MGDVRLVAFDLDGTLLDDRGRMSNESVGALRRLALSGIAMASISGRNVGKSLAPFLPDLRPALHVGSYNGAMVLGTGADGERSLLYEQRLPADGFPDLVDFVGNSGVNFIYCRCETDRSGLSEAYLTDEETAWIRNLVRMTGVNIVLEPDLLSMARDLVPPPKMILLPGPGRREGLFERMRAAFGRRFYLARTGDDRIEIMHPEVNKAVALREICDACGVAPSQSLAIGDGDNDLPMLKAAGIGVLMGNADRLTRDSAAGAGVRMCGSLAHEGFSKTVARYVSDG
ncbi:MAG: HAD hydrolase family protein [Gemmatimonadota bacterium]|nr:HAD hydrolase family protein [Gemmatimonadota bacterium]